MLSHLKIGSRLNLCFGIMVVLMLAIAARSMAQSSSLRQKQLSPLDDIREAPDQTGIAACNAVTQGDDGPAARELALLDRQRDIISSGRCRSSRLGNSVQ
jgi:hypothetical protein